MAHCVSLCLGFNRILWGKGTVSSERNTKSGRGLHVQGPPPFPMGSSQCAEIGTSACASSPGLWMVLWVEPTLGNPAEQQAFHTENNIINNNNNSSSQGPRAERCLHTLLPHQVRTGIKELMKRSLPMLHSGRRIDS